MYFPMYSRNCFVLYSFSLLTLPLATAGELFVLLWRDERFLLAGVSSKMMYKCNKEGGKFFSRPLDVMYFTLYVQPPFAATLIFSIRAMPPGLLDPGPILLVT